MENVRLGSDRTFLYMILWTYRKNTLMSPFLIKTKFYLSGKNISYGPIFFYEFYRIHMIYSFIMEKKDIGMYNYYIKVWA